MKEQETETEYKSGLTWKSLLAIVYSSLFFMPIGIFYTLITGGGMSGAVYITAFLFAQIATMFGSGLSKQEVCVIFSWTGSAAAGGWFLGLLLQGYIATSPITAMFKDPVSGKALIDLIPWWVAPHYGSAAYLTRTFFSPEWSGPIAVLILTTAFTLLQQIPLVMIMSQLYIHSEKLPFPLASIDQAIIETLSENKGRMSKVVFMLSALLGLIWGTILYAAPIISQGIFQVPLTIIPIPWADLTYYTQAALPGACIGIATDLIPWITGAFLPGSVVVSMFIGSISIWVIGNWLITSGILPFFPQWTKEYTTGMSITLIYQRATLWVWVSPIIGFTLAAGIFPLVRHWRAFAQSFNALRKLPGAARKAGYLPLTLLIILYIAGSVGSVFLFHFLIPDFPIWVIAILSIGYSFFIAMITGRMQGETGYQVTVPHVWEATILASGYSGVEAWFYSAPIISSVGSQVQTLKVFELTNTRPSDYFKSWLLVTPLSLVMSFVVVSIFWSIAPIPSGFYPNTAINWPVRAITQGLWATRQFNVFRPDLILGAMGAMLAVATVFEFLPVPFSLTGLVVGAATLPPTGFATFGGWIIGKYVGQRFIGKDRWRSLRPVLAGGIVTGEGIALGIAAAALIVVRALWSLPY